MKANLITHSDGFVWEDLSIDRSEAIEDLILAQKECSDHGDTIFSSPLLLQLEQAWGSLFDLSTKNDAELLKLCPWLTRDHQRFLARIINGRQTPKASTTLLELQQEFPKQNNSWFGLDPIELPRYVSDIASWNGLHTANIWEFYSMVDKKSVYFGRFYVAKLTVNGGTLKRSIELRREHEIFLRLDLPKYVKNQETLHGEQTQMHFNDKDKSALNLNGEWKHGGFNIPRKARLQLIKWGFIVPE